MFYHARFKSKATFWEQSRGECNFKVANWPIGLFMMLWQSSRPVDRLSFVSNAIPASETNTKGAGYNYVSTVNDLSDVLTTR